MYANSSWRGALKVERDGGSHIQVPLLKMSTTTLQVPCGPHGQPTHFIIWTEGSTPSSSSYSPSSFHEPILNALRQLTERIQVLETELAAVKAHAQQPQPQPQPQAGLYFPPAASPHLAGLDVHAVPPSLQPAEPEPEEPEPLRSAAYQQDVEEEEEEEEEEDDVPDMDPLKRFEWKDKSGVLKTYWKDTQNQVYEEDEDGDLNDSPIGIWNEAKQKLQRYAKEA